MNVRTLIKTDIYRLTYAVEFRYNIWRFNERDNKDDLKIYIGKIVKGRSGL